MSLWKPPFGYDVLSDLDQAREQGMGRRGRSEAERRAGEEEGSGRKYGSYQHSPRQKNRAMMKAKSREEGRAE